MQSADEAVVRAFWGDKELLEIAGQFHAQLTLDLEAVLKELYPKKVLPPEARDLTQLISVLMYHVNFTEDKATTTYEGKFRQLHHDALIVEMQTISTYYNIAARAKCLAQKQGKNVWTLLEEKDFRKRVLRDVLLGEVNFKMEFIKNYLDLFVRASQLNEESPVLPESYGRVYDGLIVDFSQYCEDSADNFD